MSLTIWLRDGRKRRDVEGGGSDCRILVDAGYSIERVVPIDQFVWSPHLEAVAVLRRGK